MTLMTDDDLMKLSAYADGELPAPERTIIEARLKCDPAFVGALTAMNSLTAAARNEPVPTSDFDAAASRLQVLAAAEEVPIVAPERFVTVWKEISLHTAALAETAPNVESAQWRGVWSGIASRTAKPSAIEIKPAPLRPIAKTSPFSRAWMGAVGLGLAASIIVALGLPSTPAQITPGPSVSGKPTDSAALGAISMSIPEAQDDHYGVRIRFVPGNSDPVVSLYYKTPARPNGLMSGDLDER